MRTYSTASVTSRGSLDEGIALAASTADVAIPLETKSKSMSEGHTIKPPTKFRWAHARHSLGIVLLLITVTLWTASNFLASTIFADNSYSKPFFVTYVNSAFFCAFFIFVFAKRLIQGVRIRQESYRSITSQQTIEVGDNTECAPFLGTRTSDPDDPSVTNAMVTNNENEGAPFLDNQVSDIEQAVNLGTRTAIIDDSRAKPNSSNDTIQRMSDRETAWLSLEFCVLWFLANYFVAACLEYTTVASSTILTSTSSIWTLFLATAIKVEQFTLNKLLGTFVSLLGIIMTSSLDLTGSTDEHRGDFPHKTRKELAIGDGLALASAVLYGAYATLMKKRIGNESRVDMPLFFAYVGAFNLIALLPGFVMLHYSQIETFELPPTRRITTIVLVNSTTSLLSDLCWAYSMLLTSPLVVTVGLSLTIPLSLFGQMILNNQTSSIMYWIGASIVVLSFIFINYESSRSEDRTEEEDSVQSISNRDIRSLWPSGKDFFINVFRSVGLASG